ncbi:MAG: hypothetical protein GY711_11430 [bacterium]|nr:hypothetical protein [bacterium]
MAVLHPRAEVGKEVSALLDTGATDCMISVALADELGLPVRGKKGVATAGGLRTASIVECRLVAMDGDRQLGVIRTPVLALDRLCAELVIGVSLLGQGTFELRGREGHWLWSVGEQS